jgi:hypothetical protein
MNGPEVKDVAVLISPLSSRTVAPSQSLGIRCATLHTQDVIYPPSSAHDGISRQHITIEFATNQAVLALVHGKHVTDVDQAGIQVSGCSKHIPSGTHVALSSCHRQQHWITQSSLNTLLALRLLYAA